jgi:hypothetical protein
METNMITILIPTTAERRPQLERCIQSIREHTTQPYKLMIYENKYEGYVKAIQVLLSEVDGIVWCLNDDVVLKNDALKILTEEFGKRFPQMNGLLQPSDGIQEGNVATLPFCHSAVMRKLTFKGYHHNFADQEFTLIMKELGLFAYIPEAQVEHLHWINNKAPKDMTYGYSANHFNEDQVLFEKRQANKFQPKND